MTINQARMSLISVFLGSLMIQVIAFFYASQYMWPEDLQALILKLLAIYSVHLGVIAGGVFAQTRGHSPKPSPIAAMAAILLAVVWNLLLVGQSIAFVILQQSSTSDLIKYLETVSDYGSFLVVGALAFFFTKTGEKTTTRSH